MERRDSPRRNRCFFRAFVYFTGNLTAVDCVVRDISDTGARLEFSKPQQYTEFLDLHIPIKRQTFHSKVRWDEGNEIGVAFNAASNTDADDIGLDTRIDRIELEIAALRHAIKTLQKNTDKKTEAA